MRCTKSAELNCPSHVFGSSARPEAFGSGRTIVEFRKQYIWRTAQSRNERSFEELDGVPRHGLSDSLKNRQKVFLKEIGSSCRLYQLERKRPQTSLVRNSFGVSNQWAFAKLQLEDTPPLCHHWSALPSGLWNNGPRHNLATKTYVGDARWSARLVRARELQVEHAPAASALRFYEATLEFQREVSGRSTKLLDCNVGLRERIDLSGVCLEMPGILRVAVDHGPEKLRAVAHQLLAAGEEGWCELLQGKIFQTSQDANNPGQTFFARACLQPVAENLQVQLHREREEDERRNICPACGGLPQMAVLYPEGEGASRWLLCSFCLREWPFRRVICPWCGEEDKEKLPQYSSEEFPHVRIEGCDTCKRYLKAIDLSKNGLAEPLVDEAATIVLDVWANEHGYTKIVPNLLGF